MLFKINEGNLLRAGFITAAIGISTIYYQQEVSKCNVQNLDTPTKNLSSFCQWVLK